MVDNDIYLMNALNRKLNANDGPMLLSAADQATLGKIAYGTKFMTPTSGSSVLSKSQLSLSESFVHTKVPGSGKIKVMTPVDAGNVLIGTDDRTFIVTVNDVKDMTIDDDDEVLYYDELNNHEKRIVIDCVS